MHLSERHAIRRKANRHAKEAAHMRTQISDILRHLAIACVSASLLVWVSVNAITGCNRLDPDACVMAPWVGN